MDDPRQIDLEKHIFGGGSDLSESDSDREPSTRKPRKPPTKRSHHGQQQHELSRISPVGSDGSGGEDYVREKPKAKKRRAKTAAGEDGEEGVPKKKRKKKEKSPQPLVELTEEEQRRLRLDQSIKDILQPSKGRKKRTKKNEDDLDRAADDYITALRGEMMLAAEDDKRAHQEGLPALSKLRMLERVMDVLQKRQYSTSIMDQDLLGACKVWLEPLDSRSLPAHNIQKAFFEHFAKMNIDTETLRESGLGRIVLFYTKCKRVSEPIKRIASQLVDTWTRPILKRSSSYRDKIVPTLGAEEIENKTSIPKLSAILQRARLEDEKKFGKEAGGGGGGSQRVRVPERQFMEFKVAPRISSTLLTRNPLDDTLESRKANREMMKRLQKTPGKGRD